MDQPEPSPDCTDCDCCSARLCETECRRDLICTANCPTTNCPCAPRNA